MVPTRTYIRYEDSFLDAGYMCMLMAVADGGSLEGRLRRAKEIGEPLDQAWVLDCLVQLCSCVHYLHSCRVLHRDIKPANILLLRDGTPQLADFGISIPMMSDESQLCVPATATAFLNRKHALRIPLLLAEIPRVCPLPGTATPPLLPSPRPPPPKMPCSPFQGLPLFFPISPTPPIYIYIGLKVKQI